ncbi:membrane protein [Litorimonas cladophorae]|uniref:Membrane protein n=1 Tax=Litorimonas cladophorae TaxID=1220491 RepID=A0A918KQR9_9PROT|nr:DUF2177 family protein [Litorimonas cladophorae]GGX72344.1 membrane protein [Litorimonas cladophorae]
MTNPTSLLSVPFSTLAICYGLTVIAFFVIDLIWLGVVAKSFYSSQLGELMADSPKWGVAIGFYLLYVVGIVIFAARPALMSDAGLGGSILTAAIYGGLFGFFCYATYDLTNLATLKGWPVKMVAIDIVWGTVLTGSCAAIGVALTQMIVAK